MQVEYTFFTCPRADGGIPSINSPADASASATICLSHLLPLLPQHDAFLVACYSAHPLVSQLKSACGKLGSAATLGQGTDGRGARKYVTGIFEASVLASLALVDETPHGGFGIVSTGKVWEEALDTAVTGFLGGNDRTGEEVEERAVTRFHGCETTGLNASELHELPAEEVRIRMVDATKRLLKRGASSSQGEPGSRVKAICLGCAGMVGLESAVRTACVEELGVDAGKAVYIVDGVKAGVGVLYGLARTGF